MDSEIHLFHGQLAKTERASIYFSEVLLALVKITFFLCIFVPWAMSRRALLAVLLVYVDCWKSISVWNYSVCWTLICLHVRCHKMLIIYDTFRYCCCSARNEHFSCFPHFLFFNVALHDLGPIDQHYVLCVGVFDFLISTWWDLFNWCCSFCRFILYNTMCFGFVLLCIYFFFQIGISRFGSQTNSGF